MCRNIHTLHNFDPPATPDEIRAAALQYVRKVSGYSKPPEANRAAFDRALDAVTKETARLLHALVSAAPPRTREAEAAKARERWMRREARMRGEAPPARHPHTHRSRSGADEPRARVGTRAAAAPRPASPSRGPARDVARRGRGGAGAAPTSRSRR
jgi:hypothetical protein